MRLSEAIRLGAMLRPQAFHTLYNDRDGTSCAMGAASEAIGILDTTRYNMFKEGARGPKAWEFLLARDVCPACPLHSDTREKIVHHLNNDHRWTRERIADWVSMVEPQEAPAETAPFTVVEDADLAWAARPVKE